jgi:hypothetical protein
MGEGDAALRVGLFRMRNLLKMVSCSPLMYFLALKVEIILDP